MYFIMHVPMQRLIIPDLWILLSGLLWSWYQIHCRRSLCFCVWMIQWYLNLAQNLKMFQNCLTMLHTTVPTIWMDTALWVSCSAYLSGIGIKFLIFPYKKRTGISFWIKSGHSQSDIFCHFREKYRNTYKIKYIAL